MTYEETSRLNISNTVQRPPRDISRIDSFCEELKHTWKHIPDIRFGQFMVNLFYTIQRDGIDPFYVEDDQMLNYIKAYAEKYL